ncbi:MAG: PrsW family glutamic-type intramembrane protease [Thermoplasmata archaeon]
MAYSGYILPALIGLIAFLPSLLWALSLRKAATRPVPLITCLLVFLWGATCGIIIALILEVFFPDNPGREYLLIEQALWMPVVAAPLCEEFAKGAGLSFFKSRLTSGRVGIVLGGFSGLGFAATENLFYELGALYDSLTTYILTAVIRSIAACLLHGSASAVFGLGYGRQIASKSSIIWMLPYYGIAVFMHGAYNYMMSTGNYGLVGFGATVFFTIIIWLIVRKMA